MRWTAEGRSDETRHSRERERWMALQAAEEATFSGVLLDLAESGTTVAVTTASGRRHRGTIELVSSALCVLLTDGGAEVLLRPSGIVNVRPHLDSRAPGLGDRRTRPGPSIHDALGLACAERLRVTIWSSGGREGLSGILVSVGADVVLVELDGSSESAYVPLDSVDEVILS